MIVLIILLVKVIGDLDTLNFLNFHKISKRKQKACLLPFSYLHFFRWLTKIFEESDLCLLRCALQRSLWIDSKLSLIDKNSFKNGFVWVLFFKCDDNLTLFSDTNEKWGTKCQGQNRRLANPSRKQITIAKSPRVPLQTHWNLRKHSQRHRPQRPPSLQPALPDHPGQQRIIHQTTHQRQLWICRHHIYSEKQLHPTDR